MKKIDFRVASMKRAIILFWHGFTGILACIANWFTVILGMSDDSKYGKFLRRVVGTCFAFLMLLLAIAAGCDVCRTIYNRLDISTQDGDCYGQFISRNVTYYCEGNGTDGYLLTIDGQKPLTGIKWIVKPLGDDSLICYSDGKKRGYFNMFTGEPVIKAKYPHAWIFSEGLAAVDDDGWIKFINTAGEVAIDPKVPFFAATEGYVFHGNHCVMHNDNRSRVGLIDKNGNWALKAEYFRIEPVDSFWIVDNGKQQSVLADDLRTIIPFINGKLYVNGNYIDATMADHAMKRYNMQGELIEDFFINEVSYMTYDTEEMRYTKSPIYDENGNDVGVSDDEEPTAVKGMARCRKYEAARGWYGLMSPDGKIITLPMFDNIEAVGYDLYLCKDYYADGILLNGQGERVR